MSKKLIEDKLIELRWVPTFKQIADALTKSMKDLLLTDLKRRGLTSLVSTSEDEREEIRRAAIRRGQRERRAARGKTSGQQVFPGM